MTPTLEDCEGLVEFGKWQAEAIGEAAAELLRIHDKYEPIFKTIREAYGDEFDYEVMSKEEPDFDKDFSNFIRDSCNEFEEDIARVYFKLYKISIPRPYPHTLIDPFPEEQKCTDEEAIKECNVIVKMIDGKICIRLPLLKHRLMYSKGKKDRVFYKQLGATATAVKLELEKFINEQTPDLSSFELKTVTYFFATHKGIATADNDNRTPKYITEVIARQLPGGSSADKCSIAYKGLDDTFASKAYTLIVISPGLDSVQSGEELRQVLPIILADYEEVELKKSNDSDALSSSMTDQKNRVVYATTNNINGEENFGTVAQFHSCFHSIFNKHENAIPSLIYLSKHLSAIQEKLYKDLRKTDDLLYYLGYRDYHLFEYHYDKTISYLSARNTDLAYMEYNLYKLLGGYRLEDEEPEAQEINHHRRIGQKIFGLKSYVIGSKLCFLMTQAREAQSFIKDDNPYHADYTRNLADDLQTEMTFIRYFSGLDLSKYETKTISFVFVEPDTPKFGTNETKDTKALADSVLGRLPYGDSSKYCTFFYTTIIDSSISKPYTLIIVAPGCDSSQTRAEIEQIRSVLRKFSFDSEL